MLATAACENAYVKPIAAAKQNKSVHVIVGERVRLTEESDGTACPGEDTHSTLVVAGDRRRRRRIRIRLA
jgi:hypothetical protein